MSKHTSNLNDTLYEYMLSVSLRESAILTELRQETQKLAYGKAQVTPEQGQFIALLVKLLNVKKAIEIGTFTGYSALCIAQAMSDDGKLITCDINKEWTNIAKQFWQRANVNDKIDLRLVPAIDTLDQLIANQQNNFDLIFIDADKANYLNYYQRALMLIKVGGLIIIDNVLWYGEVANKEINNKRTQAIRELNEFVKNDQRVDISLVPMGDGMLLVRKKF